MALVVNTNVSSLNAQRQLNSTTNEMSTAMERLSSGKRINTAADDAAGLAISTRMTSQVKGLTMAIRNANDGISLVQTAEGALEETTNMLQRMRELAVQASNSTMNESDRIALNDEVSQLMAEIDRVAGTTRFNNQAILSGSYAANLQIGDQADQTLAFGISNVSSSAMGETANGLATQAQAAELSVGGVSQTVGDYAGKTFTVNVNGSTATVTLPSASTATPASATVSVVGEDLGPAASTVIGSQSWTAQTVDMTAATTRVFEIRNGNESAGYTSVDFSNALADQMGLTLQQLETGELINGVEGDKVNGSDLVAAIQTALDESSELQGSNRVLVSLNDKGAITFTDVNGRSDTISLREGETSVSGTVTAATFVDGFVYDGLGTGEATAIVGGSGLLVDFSTTDEYSIFKANVNNTGYVTVDFLDKLNDTSIVKDRANVFGFELVNAMQAELDELFTGDNAVTVGINDNGQITFTVAGGDRTIIIDDTNFVDGSGASAASSFAEDILVGTSAATTIDNDANTLADTTLASVNTLFEDDNYAFNIKVNGGDAVDIDMAPYLQAAVTDSAAITGEEVVSALQAALDDNFSGDDAISVSLTSDGKIKFDVAGGLETALIQNTDVNNDGTLGDFVTRYINSANLDINENVLATTGFANAQYGSVTYGSHVAVSAPTTAVEFLNEERGFGVSNVSLKTPFAATDGSGAGFTVSSANNELALELDGTTLATLEIDQGFYTNMQDLADSIQSEIEASGKFAGDNALTVSIGSYTNESASTLGQQDYLVITNAAGKRIEIGDTFATDSTVNGTYAFGAERDSMINSTALFQELGIEPDTSDAYRTHDRVTGGVDTTADSGLVSLQVEADGSSYNYQLVMNQDENTSFSDFVSDLESKANAAFASSGITFAASLVNGEMNITASGAEDLSFTLDGAIVEDAFGGSVSAASSNGGPLTSMDDVVSAINEDLASVDATVTFDGASLVFSDASGATGSSSSITVSGDDLAAIQASSTTLAASGVASDATAVKLSEVDITTVEGASAALAAIDNSIEYVSSQRSELGAIENRLNHTISNLSNVVENTSAARSRIEDADFAVEAANLAKAQVMQQAGTAMLAQANASAQSVLSLLG